MITGGALSALFAKSLLAVTRPKMLVQPIVLKRRRRYTPPSVNAPNIHSPTSSGEMWESKTDQNFLEKRMIVMTGEIIHAGTS